MAKRKKRFNWSAVAAALVSVAGVVSHPAVLALIPGKTAAILTAAGVVLQAVTHAVHAPHAPASEATTEAP